jgi:hypothetical protein
LSDARAHETFARGVMTFPTTSFATSASSSSHVSATQSASQSSWTTARCASGGRIGPRFRGDRRNPTTTRDDLEAAATRGGARGGRVWDARADAATGAARASEDDAMTGIVDARRSAGSV